MQPVLPDPDTPTNSFAGSLQTCTSIATTTGNFAIPASRYHPAAPNAAAARYSADAIRSPGFSPGYLHLFISVGTAPHTHSRAMPTVPPHLAGIWGLAEPIRSAPFPGIPDIVRIFLSPWLHSSRIVRCLTIFHEQGMVQGRFPQQDRFSQSLQSAGLKSASQRAVLV
jgi:hypothetical protein